MVERRIIAEEVALSYEGLFNVVELYQLINNWFSEKGFTPHELDNLEHVSEHGKDVEYIIEPYRRVTDYVKYVIRVELGLHHVHDTTVEKNGVKTRYNEGQVHIVISGFLEQDYEHRWEKKPLFYFMRAILDQFIYKVNTDRYERGLKEEVTHLHTTLKAFLNLYRY